MVEAVAEVLQPSYLAFLEEGEVVDRQIQAWESQA